jgi:hypothetical protein
MNAKNNDACKISKERERKEDLCVLHLNEVLMIFSLMGRSRQGNFMNTIVYHIRFNLFLRNNHTRLYPKVSGLAAWSEN